MDQTQAAVPNAAWHMGMGMATNCVLLVRDRLELTRQTVTTMFEHAATASFTLTIVDDGSGEETRLLVEQLARTIGLSATVVVRLYPPSGIVGLCRNLGILASERIFGRGEFLYLADNDCYFLPGWLDTLTAAFKESEPHGIRLLGAYTHPFHGTNKVMPIESLRKGTLLDSMAAPPHMKNPVVRTHDAVQGISHLMRWKTWQEFGPFDAHARGTNQSEDFAFCRRIVEAGYLVGSVYPRTVLNCGLLDSYGNKCVGYDAVRAELLDEISSRGLEGKVFYQESP